VIEVGMFPYTKHAFESKLKSHAHKLWVFLIRDAFSFLLLLLMCHCAVRVFLLVFQV